MIKSVAAREPEASGMVMRVMNYCLNRMNMIACFRNALMRKMIVCTVVLLGALSASAALPLDKYSVNRKDLPEEAKAMLDEHFPKAKVSMIKVDRHLLKKTDYDVKLTNGTKIEFSNKGRWTLVDCKKKSVPEALVPKAIRSSVAKRYADTKIVRISRSSLYYLVGLDNGKELKYDRLGILQGEVSRKEAEAFENEALAEADSISAAHQQ